MIFNVQETFLSRKDQKKNKREKEKKEKKNGGIEQFRYESAKHFPNYR